VSLFNGQMRAIRIEIQSREYPEYLLSIFLACTVRDGFGYVEPNSVRALVEKDFSRVTVH